VTTGRSALAGIRGSDKRAPMSTLRPSPITQPDQATLRAALELALRAPSLHNSQPWRWRIDGPVVQLHLDDRRRLPVTDPRARELVISCGAALHHLEVALAAQGWPVRVRRLPDPDEPTHLATITPHGHPARAAETGLASAIARRRTDRRRFGSWPVPAELVGELIEAADLRGARLQAVTDPRPRRRLFRAMTEATERQADDPAVSAELAAWSGRETGSPDGVPADHVPAPQHSPGRPPMRPFAEPQLGESPHGGEPEAAALLVASTAGDEPRQWLLAGEVASAALLAATRDGLASSVLTQPLEVDDVRAFLREHVVGDQFWHPQLILRIGWLPAGTPELPSTPRRPLDDVLADGHEPA
jgi:Nitroreductase family